MTSGLPKFVLEEYTLIYTNDYLWNIYFGVKKL